MHNLSHAVIHGTMYTVKCIFVSAANSKKVTKYHIAHRL